MKKLISRSLITCSFLSIWILTSCVSIPEDIKQNYLKIAQDIGYKTENLIWVEHDR